MKCCIVIIDLHCDPTIPSGAGDIGGGNTYSRSLLQELQNAEIYHIYITRKKYSYLEEYIHMTPLSHFYRIDLGDWGPIDKDVLQNFHAISKQKILEILKNYTEYNFIFHSSYWQSGMLAYEIAPMFQTFYVHTILSNAKKKRLTGATDDIVEQRIAEEEKIFTHAKYLICSSLSEMKEMQDLYSIPKERLLLAGLKVDNHYLSPAYNLRGEIRINALGNVRAQEQYLSYFSHDSEKDNGLWWNRKNFIYFGRIHKNKGIKEILLAWKQALEIIGDNMPDLWIVGGAPNQIENFRNNIIKELPWLTSCEKQHRVIWWGTLPPEGISTLLLKSSVLLTHSKYEAGGLVLLEALSQGLPVIATPNGYGNDYLIDWYNGFKVNYKDIDTLTQKILYFCGQPFLCDYMGQNAKKSSIMISNSFDFLYTHKFSYGIVTKEKANNYTFSETDWYKSIKVNSMDTYPFLTELPTKDVMEDILKRYIDCIIFEIKEISDLVSDFKLWKIDTNVGTYLFAYYYDIINTTNIWNPYSKENYVLTKSQRVNSIVDIFEKINSAYLIYKNTSYGYVLFKGEIDEVFSMKSNILKINQISLEDEQYVLYSKYDELLQILDSPILKKYNITPLIEYLKCLTKNFEVPIVSPNCTLPYVCMCNLFYEIDQNTFFLAYDKKGLQYPYLRNIHLKTSNVSALLDKDKLSIEELWTIYFECYTYIEQIITHSNDNRNTFIQKIYKL